MRRIGSVWETIVSFDNLVAAARRAASGKGSVKGVARFLERLEPEVLALQRELVDGTYKPGVPTTFVVHDPKVREITAAPFRDRVVHHALIDVLEPFFDQRLIHHSYACRRGKGQHRAMRHAQRLVRRFRWFLKLDVKGFFPSLGHDVVLATVQRIVKDRNALALCEVIVRHGSAEGRGLPIGHLTSQWFANLVLDRMDHWVTEVLHVPGYVRYMDDFVLLGDDKQFLRAWLGEIEAFLAAMELRLKDAATLLAPVTQGLPFLGFRIYRGTVRLRPENLRRSKARLRHRAWQQRQGLLDEAQLADAMRSVVAHMAHGNTLALRRAWFASSTSGAGRRLLQPLQPRRQLQQPGRERTVGQPQQQRRGDPQQHARRPGRQDVTPPDAAVATPARQCSAP